MSYKDYLEKGNNINPELLAPVTAIPKYSKGNYPKARRFESKMKKKESEGKTISVKDLQIPKQGYLLRRKK